MRGSNRVWPSNRSRHHDSAQECVPLLEIARRRGFVTDGQHAQLLLDLEEIAKMLSGLINGLEKRTT
ncbi:MAG: four helix bundle protein [Phycisphaeraceae bacterium]|nr:four helix bundle protein [Phycisphaeraceae bacterium]